MKTSLTLLSLMALTSGHKYSDWHSIASLFASIVLVIALGNIAATHTFTRCRVCFSCDHNNHIKVKLLYFHLVINALAVIDTAVYIHHNGNILTN